MKKIEDTLEGINYKEAVDGCLDVIHRLKKCEAAVFRLEDLIREVRNSWKHDYQLPLRSDERDIDYFYRSLLEVMGDANGDF